jgi:hypothetical protein
MGVNDVRQTEMHIAEPLLPEPNYFEVEITTEKSQTYTSPAINQILRRTDPSWM